MEGSEVARLREQIRREYEAAQWGLQGLALGVAQHQFMTARTENLGAIHEKLTALVGPHQAIKILAETLDQP